MSEQTKTEWLWEHMNTEVRYLLSDLTLREALADGKNYFNVNHVKNAISRLERDKQA